MREVRTTGVGMTFIGLIKDFLPKPQHNHSTSHAEYEVGEVAFAKQFDVQQAADERSGITAHDTNNKVHAASFAFAAHDAVGDVAN